MLGNTYYYNRTIKKITAAFGSLFNDLHIANTDGGKLNGVQRVPLAYGPREKYLARINSDERESIALKLPRMSFEMNDISYDQSTKLNKVNRTIQRDEAGDSVRVWQSAPYNLTYTLNILSRGQDEALQILEQILPHFNPNYTLAVKGLEGPESKTDVPITLQGIAATDDYEGDFEGSRRTVTYALTFEVKVKFSLPVTRKGLIKRVDVKLYDYFEQDEPLESVKVSLGSDDDTFEDYTTVVEIFNGDMP